MYNVKLYNKISKVGLDDLDPAKVHLAPRISPIMTPFWFVLPSCMTSSSRRTCAASRVQAPVSTTFRSTAAPRKAL